MFLPQSHLDRIRVFVTITPHIKLCMSTLPFNTVSQLILQISHQLKHSASSKKSHITLTSLLLQDTHLPKDSLISQVLRHKDHISCEVRYKNPIKKIKRGIKKITKLMIKENELKAGEKKKARGWKKRKIRNEKDISKYSSVSTHESAMLNC